MIRRQNTSGFALPTILVASVVMLIVLLSAVTASSSIRSAIDGQYYSQIAREAAESGLARAQGCLQASASVPTWSDVKPLQPWTDCSGNHFGEPCIEEPATYTKTVCGVVIGNGIRSSFTVKAPSMSPGGVQIITVQSVVQLLRTSNNTVWRTYTGSASASVGSNITITYTGISNAQPQAAIGMPLAAQSFSFGADGNVYGLGYNQFGILGDGTLVNAQTPVKFQLPGGLRARSVSVNALSGGINAFVITSDDQVYGAGVNNNGQLGNGATTLKQATPVRFNLPVGEKASQVALLGETTYVITQSGAVYGAGAGTFGQLGSGSAQNSTTPVKMILPVGEKAVSLSADWHMAYIVTESGKAYVTGINDWGQAGNGNRTQINTPIRFTTAGDAGQPTVQQIVTDGVSGWALLSDGTIWGAGRSMDGQLGNNTLLIQNGSYSAIPVQFQIGSEKAVSMASDYNRLVAVTASGKVFGAGANNSGDLGCGNATQQNAPCQFILPVGKLAKSIINTGYDNGPTGTNDLYGDNTFVITTDGSVYGTGDNYYGQLGVGAAGAFRTTPVLMILPSGITAQSIRAGAGTVVVLGSDGRVYSVGNNNYGQLGTGTTTNVVTPTATNYLNLQPRVLF